jgi:hypothetical protein
MSAAAGAPPPPPPPPPKRSFDALPAELLLEIIGYLQLNDFNRFALAFYRTLQQHGLVPPLTGDVYNRITRRPSRCRNAMCLGGEACAGRKGGTIEGGETNDGYSERHGPASLPVELNEQIMHHLEPADRLAWLFSDQGMFAAYVPRLTEETRRHLREALRIAQQDVRGDAETDDTGHVGGNDSENDRRNGDGGRDDSGHQPS